MKRPEGYDRPPAGAERAAGPKATAANSAGAKPAAAKTGRPKPGGRQSSGHSDHANTEPITLPADPIAPVSRLRAPDSSPSSAPAPTEPRDSALTPAGARRKLRAARRARKLYEREEVRRFTWRSRRRRNIWLTALGILGALVAFVLVGTFSPLMALRTIEVVGANRVPAEQIQSALDGQLGTPLPLVDFDAVKQELSAFTLIQSYVTESRPPNTLVVRIVEREPVGALVTESGFDLVDAAGVVIQSGAERPAGYATIDARAGVGSAGFRAAAAVIAALPADIRSTLDTVTAATTDDVTLTLVGGARVVWGSAEKSDFKAVVLAALIVSHPIGSVGEYDVSSPDSAVLR
ncbi:FtsQ-type POTRA domain-containing protein [Cryobacterium sp. TMT2-15-1]|uniref:FtsQ-type POTRA domain-containing protein n=1 Tax=Cryobacterium sp. TMT2-15-1 TaxID=1259246 RepID=UPI00106ADC6E|nr:FtsQ-type POTRA domain-containing protein [Cryobacterium sp. TMT2-15-1]TFC63930.1 FtsQ-type POTRA domain-containing protein [Cryobacterium sp. TMT2-15-1]